MEQLKDKDREYMLSNSPAALPDDPSKWSPARIREKFYMAFVILFAWLKDIQKDGKDDKATFEEFKNKLVNLGEVVSKRAELDKDGHKIASEDWSNEMFFTIEQAQEALTNFNNVCTNLGNAIDDLQTWTAQRLVERLARENDTAYNLYIHQMGSGEEAVVSKGYVDDKVSNAINSAVADHIVSIEVTKNVANGTYTITLTKTDGSKISTSFDTPDEKIIDNVRLNGTDLEFTWVNEQKTVVDLTSFMNVYSGSAGEDISIMVDEEANIHATFSSKWVDFLNGFKSKEEIWERNEIARETLKGELQTLETNLNTIKTQLQPAVDLFGSNAYLTQEQYDALADKSGVHFVEIAE